MPQPATRPALRNHRLSGHLYAALHRRGDRAAWHDEVHHLRFWKSGGGSRCLRAAAVGRSPVFPLRDRGRRPHGDDLLSAGLPIWPGADLVRDVARRPIAQAVLRGGLMTGLTVITWLRFLIWLTLGLCIYIFYSRHRSEFAEKA